MFQFVNLAWSQILNLKTLLIFSIIGGIVIVPDWRLKWSSW